MTAGCTRPVACAGLAASIPRDVWSNASLPTGSIEQPAWHHSLLMQLLWSDTADSPVLISSMNRTCCGPTSISPAHTLVRLGQDDNTTTAPLLLMPLSYYAAKLLA